MAARSTWYSHAAAAIRRAMAEAAALHLDPAETKRLVDAAYPFGERAYHPYKMWLRARRDLLLGTDAPGATAQEQAERALLAAWNNAEPIRDNGPAVEMRGLPDLAERSLERNH